MLLVATAVFGYYTVWTLVLPFTDESSALNKFFLPREYAIKIPVLLLILGITAVGSFIGMVMVKSLQKNKAKKN